MVHVHSKSYNVILVSNTFYFVHKLLWNLLLCFSFTDIEHRCMIITNMLGLI